MSYDVCEALKTSEKAEGWPIAAERKIGCSIERALFRDVESAPQDASQIESAKRPSMFVDPRRSRRPAVSPTARARA